jgi:hypothetical protein
MNEGLVNEVLGRLSIARRQSGGGSEKPIVPPAGTHLHSCRGMGELQHPEPVLRTTLREADLTPVTKNLPPRSVHNPIGGWHAFQVMVEELLHATPEVALIRGPLEHVPFPGVLLSRAFMASDITRRTSRAPWRSIRNA